MSPRSASRLFLDVAGLPCADPWLADPAPDPGVIECGQGCDHDCATCAQLGDGAYSSADVSQAELEQLGHDLQVTEARSSLPYGVVEELLASWRAVAVEQTENPFDAREPQGQPVAGGRLLH